MPLHGLRSGNAMRRGTRSVSIQSLRSTPELDFKFDETAMRAGRIEDLLEDINKQPNSDDE